MSPDDPVARQMLADDVERGERLIWPGRPAQGLRLRGSEAFMIPFSLLWGGFAFSWEASALGLVGFGARDASFPFDWIMALWGVPFVLVGIYIVVGRFFWDSFMRAGTSYGITTRSVLIRRRRKLTVLDLGKLPAVELNMSGRRGTLSFGASSAPFGFAAPAGWPGDGRHLPPMFELIERPREVLRIVSDARAAPR